MAFTADSMALMAEEIRKYDSRKPRKNTTKFKNGILRSRKKEQIPTLHDSMDGTGEHYAK